MCIEGKVNTRYIASCESKNDDRTYEMHHLMRVQNGSNLRWKQPTKVDKASMYPASIVGCTIDGEWDVSKERNMNFKLKNHLYVDDLVKDISKDNPN